MDGLKSGAESGHDEIRKIFRLNPGLREIGTEKQYAEYLKTIFPESAAADVMWHGSPNDRFESFDKEKVGQLDAGYYGQGFSFTKNMRFANQYRTRYRGRLPSDQIQQGSLIACKLNLKNPFQWKEGYQYFMPDPKMQSADGIEQFSPDDKAELLRRYNAQYGESKKDLNREEFEYAEDLGSLSVIGTQFLKEKGFDGSIAVNPVSGLQEYLTFESDQIHILGSQKDIQDFKNFAADISYINT